MWVHAWPSFVGLLFSEFRFGWETSIRAISQRGGGKPSFQTFMVSIVRECTGAVKPVISSFDHSSLDSNEKQVLQTCTFAYWCKTIWDSHEIIGFFFL